MDLSPIKELVKSQQAKMKAENKPVTPLTKNIRDTLKEIMQKELGQLAETVKDLESKERLNMLCKFMSFVSPKVESVNHDSRESDEFVINHIGKVSEFSGSYHK